MITILLSDLVAYGFLREQFTGDLCERRLAARHAAYRRDVPEPHQLVTNAEGPQWTAAHNIADEMMRRFARVFPNDAAQPARAPAFA